jgi:dTDP-4-dehydrorhamnose reductase
MKRILIFGVTGLLGSQLYEEFILNKKFLTKGVSRKKNAHLLKSSLKKNLIYLDEINNYQKIKKIFNIFKPNAVINCVGTIKQSNSIYNKDVTIFSNSIFPHILSSLCLHYKARLVHFSTDCVFSGKKGNYKENDTLDADDFYGKTKIIGEIINPNSITFRTSIIGKELYKKKSLLEWFLKKKKSINGFRYAYFSGLPVKEIYRVVNKVILKKKIHGIFHLSSKRINKYDLLKLFAQKFKKKIKIIKYKKFKIDRSLNSQKLFKTINYKPKSWGELIKLL